jgi:hypothetical protein
MSAATPPKPSGKGRPTPKRNEQQRRRTPSAAPKSRKEAAALQRAEVKAARGAQRAALRAGDERALPAFARGPERAAVRDAIDSRMSLGWLALPGLALNFSSFIVTQETARALLANAGFVMFAMLLFDTAAAVRRVRKLLGQRFPGGTEAGGFTLIRYAVARNTQFRRTRMPPPRVAVGDNVFPAG